MPAIPAGCKQLPPCLRNGHLRLGVQCPCWMWCGAPAVASLHRGTTHPVQHQCHCWQWWEQQSKACRLLLHCRDLIYSLLKRNPVERISFEEFFSHPFLGLRGGPVASMIMSRVGNQAGAAAGERWAG